MSRRIKPADQNNDGSEGKWSRGLPSDLPGAARPSTIDYDAQAGCPVDVSGGTYRPNVTGAPPSGAAPGPKPFKLGK
jgi:hypothetical protein